MNVSRFTNSNVGLIVISVIPAIIGYILILENVFSSLKTRNLERYYPLFYSILIFIICWAAFSTRKLIIQFKATYEKNISELKDAIAKKAQADAVINCLAEISRLWDERNKMQNNHSVFMEDINRTINGIIENNKISLEINAATTKVAVSIANTAKTLDEIDKIAAALYDKHPIPEYEKIGIDSKIIGAMKLRYYSDQLRKTESEFGLKNQPTKPES